MCDHTPIRRRDLCLAGSLLAGFRRQASGQTDGRKEAGRKEDGFRPLFDGVSLKGWKRQPRSPGQTNLGIWTVEDGVIVGGQDPPGSGVGSYLVTEEKFADFELQIEARPDWRADTGILVRTIQQGNIGFQVLLDHRPHGSIGGYYGNGLANVHAYEYGLVGETDKDGRLVKLIPEKPSEPTRRIPLDFSAPPEVFLRAWKLNGWNHFRIRSVGPLPFLTTWINGEKISELDTSKIQAPGWAPDAILKLIGPSGHIAVEVHSNGPKDWLGKDRWTPGAVCRWRNISIKTL